jgi:alginate O-acetyltransferase complex protein AlgI
MNFASWPFLAIFLPFALAGFFALGPRAHRRRDWLIFVSALFYAMSGAVNVAVLVVSIAANYAAGARLAGAERRLFVRKAVLWAAIVADVGVLAAFKAAALRTGGGAFLSGEAIMIPLGLSFVTFQQIGFVLSCHRREVQRPAFGDYLFFVLFFPKLIMGPIVRFRDVAKQLHAGALARPALNDVAIGLAIFFFGLAKKVLLADLLFVPVDRIFRTAEMSVTTVEAWYAVVGFQLQLFLDFSAYAEMAIGLAKIFGIDLPINFDRPLLATDRFDLWSRWNITFVIFMRETVFLPLVRIVSLPIPLALAVTGVLSGLWHGLGWTFVVWGLVQTAILLATHFRSKMARRTGPLGPAARVRAIALTFLVTCLVGVLFRAPSLEAAAHLYSALVPGLGASAGLRRLGTTFWWAIIAICAFTVWVWPDARSFFARYWTAIDPRNRVRRPEPAWIAFDLTPLWGAVGGAILVLTLLRLDTAARFIYVQF